MMEPDVRYWCPVCGLRVLHVIEVVVVSGDELKFVLCCQLCCRIVNVFEDDR